MKTCEHGAAPIQLRKSSGEFRFQRKCGIIHGYVQRSVLRWLLQYAAPALPVLMVYHVRKEMIMEHTFVICAYKESPYLEQCIQSLLKQRGKVHIAIATSTPNAHIQGLAKKYSLPLFIRLEENRKCFSPISQDWQFAYDCAKTDWVTLVHQDDVYAPSYFKEWQRAREKNPDMSLFCTDALTLKKGRLLHTRLEWVKRILRFPLRFKCLSGIPQVKMACLLFGNSIVAPSCTYHKGYWGKAPFLSPMEFALDWEALCRASKKKGRFICCELPLMAHRIHEGAQTAAAMEGKKRRMEEKEMFQRLWPKQAAGILALFYRTAYKAYR